MEVAGSISFPTLFVITLPVALARWPGKIAIRQMLKHTPGVSHTQNGRYKAQKEVLEVSSSCRNPILGLQTDQKI